MNKQWLFGTCTCISFGHYLNTLPPSFNGILSQCNSKPNQQGIKDRLDRGYLSRFNSIDPIAIYHSRNQKHGNRFEFNSASGDQLPCLGRFYVKIPGKYMGLVDG